MARKQSLSDLLQEEAQKFTPPEDESAIEVEVTAEEIAEEQTLSDEESLALTPESTSTKRTIPTKADLEATVKELTINLEKSHKKESSMGLELADLQSKSSKQKTFSLEQQSLIEQLTKELDGTKKTALQLAEANSQLIEEINALKQTAENNSQLVVKEASAIKPVKEHYNPLNYKKSHRSSETLAENQPQNQPNEYPDSSNEMWLLD